jgi:hypothetical protein
MPRKLEFTLGISMRPDASSITQCGVFNECTSADMSALLCKVQMRQITVLIGNELPCLASHHHSGTRFHV